MLLIAPALFDLIIPHYLKKQGYSRLTNAKWFQDTDYMFQGKIHQLEYFIFGRLIMLPYSLIAFLYTRIM